MENVREITEDIEEQTLSPLAAKSRFNHGRHIAEGECDIRTAFQRDRDRIIHSKSFRRLKHKTQVFLAPESDHYRTRLTHTLEVSQIARTVARALRLNEDLTEAIALGHDLGHTPFGHAGERALNSLCKCGFVHAEQSVRVCEKIEKQGRGLNLTDDVLNGILHHTRGELSYSLEGQVVRFSDRIAYINHDIDDAIRGGIIKKDDIPADIIEVLGDSKSRRIDTLVRSLIENSSNTISMDENTAIYYDKLHKFLFSAVYTNRAAKAEEDKVEGIVEGLFEYYLKNPDKMTKEYLNICENEGIERAVSDYIAGMTDHYAVMTFSDIYIPKFWKV